MLFSKNKKIALIAVLFVILSIVVESLVDWQVSGYSKQPEIYAFWFNTAMFMFGFGTALTLLELNPRKQGPALFATITVSTAILIFANFEDCMYFLLGAGGFPANNVQWNWMIQYKWFHSWTTPDQLIWTIGFLLILAAFLYCMLKFGFKSR
jgi:hypothetical protein